MKPVVHYRKDLQTQIADVGGYSLISPIDHPNPNGTVSNKSFVLTSRVVRVGENGEFETQNTVYRPQSVN